MSSGVLCAREPAIGVTQDQREATSFWGTSDTGAWARLAGSSWAPARLDRRRTFHETFLPCLR